MDELTLCKKIVNLEYPNGTCDGYDRFMSEELLKMLNNKHPNEGKGLLFDLMVKYKVEVTHWDNNDGCVYIGNDIYNKTHEFSHGGIPRAILECIIEANR